MSIFGFRASSIEKVPPVTAPLVPLKFTWFPFEVHVAMDEKAVIINENIFSHEEFQDYIVECMFNTLIGKKAFVGPPSLGDVKRMSFNVIFGRNKFDTNTDVACAITMLFLYVIHAWAFVYLHSPNAASDLSSVVAPLNINEVPAFIRVMIHVNTPLEAFASNVIRFFENLGNMLANKKEPFRVVEAGASSLLNLQALKRMLLLDKYRIFADHSPRLLRIDGYEPNSMDNFVSFLIKLMFNLDTTILFLRNLREIIRRSFPEEFDEDGTEEGILTVGDTGLFDHEHAHGEPHFTSNT